MKPQIELSEKKNHTVWESGCWNAEKRVGRGCVIAGSDGEKLPVIYDRNPQKTNFQFLFFANPGQVIAMAYVSHLANGKVKYDLSLVRLTAISTEIVQGESVLRPAFEDLWSLKTITGKGTDHGALIDASYTVDRVGFKQAFKELIYTSVEKAKTPSEEQRLFWGIPRNN